jgi:hypothetical protein
MAKEMMRAVTSFVAAAKKGEISRRVNEGDVLPENDPVVKVAPNLFMRQEDYLNRVNPVEQATAAPGEMRVTKRSKAAAKKKAAGAAPVEEDVDDAEDEDEEVADGESDS